MGRVDALAELQALAARGEVGSVTVLSQRPKSQTPVASGQARLSPLLVVRVEARERFETSADLGIEGAQGLSMEAGRDGPD